MKEIGFDAEKLPLGRISTDVISEAYEILKDIESAIREGHDKDEDKDGDSDGGKGKGKGNGRRRRSRKSAKSMRKVHSNALRDLSSKYYTLIPHEFGFSVPPPINTEKMLNQEMKLIEALSEIEVASRLLKGDQEKGREELHPCDKHYRLLKSDIQAVDKAGDEFKMLADYVKLTHAETHNRYTLRVESAFKLDRHGEDERFADWNKDKNRMLLWHGSRLTNFVGIISQGLRIAPPEGMLCAALCCAVRPAHNVCRLHAAPVTGYMFGKGVYFAYMCSKSANYCFTSATNDTGLLLLCEVALGEMNELVHSDYYAGDCVTQGKHSPKGCGTTTPDPSTYVTLPNGCVVPIGKGVSDDSLQSSLLYNEYIVYDTAQIKMKYICKMKFDYGGW